MKTRNSNIEFLRIAAMFMVLMLHVNFMSIGEPTTAEAISAPSSTFFRVFFQQTANIAVNLFVLISGWYTIKYSLKGVSRFLFQCVFLISLVYVIGLVCGLTTFNVKECLECILLESNAWFVKAYLGLYILSPVLNKYLTSTDEVTQRNVLIAFFVFQTIFGAFTMSATFIKAGYSTFSFIGLYLLANYMHRYGKVFNRYALLIYLVSIIGSVLWFYLPLRFGVMRLAYMSILYTSPCCIIAAMGLLLWVANLKIRHNRFVNYFASSCFAVFLCHACNSWTLKYFTKISSDIYNNYSGLKYLLIILLFISSVFVISVALDQLRKLVQSLLKF